ncbi:SCO family protein [Methylobacterium sp. WL19]|uniref:SCO family protein n=1 Tax=Methylobacterium sp. WL19 TaxID=2603896 RepID=UPI0011CC465E|nr:SCO family protein [Methylobacterium sp. WL19]TXN27493.1 SCO family protein [Methylobacterium sp. WL19]
MAATIMPDERRPMFATSRGASNLILAAFALAAMAIIGTTIAMWPRGPAPPAVSGIGGPFRLQSSQGGELDSATLRGKPFLVFFGFTQCPNVCPTTLADLSNLLDEFHQQGGDIPAYYITVDPERDTAEVMREYMPSFGDRIVGLTGKTEEIKRVVDAYRVTVIKVPLKDGNYTLEHTLMIYVMDRNGGFVGPLSLDAGHPYALKQLVRVTANSKG